MLNSGTSPPGLPRLSAVKTKCSASNRLLEISSEASENFAVSPSTPLLSTSVSENSYVCGSNRNGQLGITGVVKLSEPQPIHVAGPWASLAFGGQHVAGLTGCGMLYTWGTNSKGQTANGQIGSCSSAPARIKTTGDKQRFKAVACGSEHTIVTTATGVLAFGSNNSGQLGLGEQSMLTCRVPTSIPGLNNMMVVQVVCGAAHTLCVTAQSQVFAWGANSVGQLGLGDCRDRWAPALVDALWALPVVQLAAGDGHSLALTTNGHMFAWGSNDSGQLGLLPDAEHAASSYISPGKNQRIVTDTKKCSVVTSKANQAFLMAMLEMGIARHHAELSLEETGNVGVEVATEWLFSLPPHVLRQRVAEREGIGPPACPESQHSSAHEVQRALEPRRVPLKNVRSMSAGLFYTVAVTDSGVYSWGDNSVGALGLGDTEDRDLPCLVSALEGQQVKQVSCGAGHTLFLTQDGAVYGCGDGASGQLTQRALQMDADAGLVLQPVKLALPFGIQRSLDPRCQAPVVHQVVAGPGLTAFITRSPNDLPEVQRITLLQRLQSAIARVSEKRRPPKSGGAASPPEDRVETTGLFKAVSSGVEAVFSSPAAISAAFGYSDRVGINMQLLEDVQQSILDLYAGECPEGEDETSQSQTWAGLHKFSISQTMFRAASLLLEDLSSHSRLLGTPERAQVLLAAFQHPLLTDHSFAKMLVPRLGSIFLSAPVPARQLLVKWWSDCSGMILLERVVKPLQAFLSKELMATKKLTIGVMNAIKVLAKVDEANQIGRVLPPDAFYNQLISDKMDVQDHYTAWRQTNDMPANRRQGADGPFSFCSYPFLLDARAKSNLLHIEARFRMEQSVAHARMEQQLYGGSSYRLREGSDADNSAVVLAKSLGEPSSSGPCTRGSGNSAVATDGESRRKKDRTTSFRGLIQGLFRGPSSRAQDDVVSAQDQQRARGMDSFRLPLPSHCTMPGTHCDMCIVRVRRTQLVEDALSEVSRQLKKDLFKPLRVHFIGEEGIDAGGVKKEFFQLLVDQLLSPDYGMLINQSESNTYWFNSGSLEGEDQFLLLGLILGLAVYNHVLLDFPLPLALYKKLLGQPVGLRDLEEMQPIFGRSLRQLLQYDGPPGSMEDVFCLTFSLETESFGQRQVIELIPNGGNIAVTEDNRLEYVEAVVDNWLNKSIARQFSAFATGFRILCDGPATRLLNAQELERLVCGNPNLDFDALQQNTKYEGGYSPNTPVVQWLWEIVRGELSLEEKKKFLKFFTGSDRAPIGGLGTLRCMVQRNGADSGKLPTSHTCFNTLLLPEYTNKAKLLHVLRVAITCCTGFGLE